MKGRAAKLISESEFPSLQNARQLVVLVTKKRMEPKSNMAKQPSDQEFLEFIIKALVDHPEDVKVTREVDEMGVLLSLKVNSEDMGQIIGRQGSTAKAIRSLVRIVGLKNHARVNLKIEEPAGGASRRAGTTKAEDVNQVVDELKL